MDYIPDHLIGYIFSFLEAEEVRIMGVLCRNKRITRHADRMQKIPRNMPTTDIFRSNLLNYVTKHTLIEIFIHEYKMMQTCPPGTTIILTPIVAISVIALSQLPTYLKKAISEDCGNNADRDNRGNNADRGDRGNNADRGEYNIYMLRSSSISMQSYGYSNLEIYYIMQPFVPNISRIQHFIYCMPRLERFDLETKFIERYLIVGIRYGSSFHELGNIWDKYLNYRGSAIIQPLHYSMRMIGINKDYIIREAITYRNINMIDYMMDN